MYSCNKCGKTVLQRNWKQHDNRCVKGIPRSKPRLCDICGKRFTQKDQLSHHILTVHGPGTTDKCEICGEEGFGSLRALQDHKNKHNWKRVFDCPRCDKQFGNSSNRDKHIRAVHTKIKPFTCTLCGKSCSDPSTIAHSAPLDLANSAPHARSRRL